MKHKNNGKKTIKRYGLERAQHARRVLRGAISKKEMIAASQKKSAVKFLPQNTGEKFRQTQSSLVSAAGSAGAANETPNPPAKENGGDFNNDDYKNKNGRWNSPRTSGLAAAVLLLAMLVTAALSSAGGVKAEGESSETALSQTATMKLAKEYVYAGSRMLAIEDYGLSSTPTATPTATPTPPTPTPTPPVATCPAGYSSLGGAISGNPTATVFNNMLFAFVRGTDNAIYHRKSSDGSNFDAYVYLGGYLISNPATLVTYNELYVQATGGNNNPYYRSTGDGVNFAAWVGGSVNVQTTASAYFNGNTYTFVQGGGTQPPLCVNVTAGGTPTPTPATPTPTPTPATPTPTPTPENYSLTVNRYSFTTIISWTSTVSRPANTDVIQIVTDDANQTEVYSTTTGGGSSGSFSISNSQLGSGDYLVRYLKDGSTNVAETGLSIP